MTSRAGVHEPERCQREDLEILCGEINWLSLVELAFSFLFPFCPHYLLLTVLWLVLCFSSAWLHSTGALPPPAGGGGERFPDAPAIQDREGEEAGVCDRGTTGRSSTCLLSCCLLSCCLSDCLSDCLFLFWTCRTCSSS